MVFKRKYPVGYWGEVAFLEEKLFGHLMNKRQLRELAESYGKRRKVPKRKVDRKTVETREDVYLVDLTTISCVPLDAKKNRFLLNNEGYYQYSFLCAKNVLTNRKYAMFMKGSQITTKAIRRLRELLKRELGFAPILVTDNQHELTLIADKKVTMWIEVEFGGLKTKLYRTLRSHQSIRNNKVFTALSWNQFITLYIDRLQRCQIKLLNPQQAVNAKPTQPTKQN